jgi:hypothetical protein
MMDDAEVERIIGRTAVGEYREGKVLHRLRLRIRYQGLVWLAGFFLVAAGIICLYLSDKVVTGWWQGTLNAFGVGFIVGGIVDVLAISGLDQRIKADDARRRENNRQAEEILRNPDRFDGQLKAAISFLATAQGPMDSHLRIGLQRTVLHTLNLLQAARETGHWAAEPDPAEETGEPGHSTGRA